MIDLSVVVDDDGVGEPTCDLLGQAQGVVVMLDTSFDTLHGVAEGDIVFGEDRVHISSS